MSKNSSPAVSVVIPVYNGAAYIERTIRSLMDQSFRDFEVICVNDGSTDSSLNILATLAQQDARVKVYSKPNGGDATQAIIYGLQYATGQYFMYSSQDDLFSVDLLEKSHRQGEASHADAVVPDMEFYSEQAGRDKPAHSICGINGDRSRMLTGPEAFVLSIDWTIHGFVLWKMDVVRGVGFATYGLSSDEFTTRMFFFHCKNVVFCDGVFYYRQDNEAAITKKWNMNQLDYLETCRRLEGFVLQRGFPETVVSLVRQVMLGHLVRIQVMFNSNIQKLKPGEVAEFKQRMMAEFRRNIPALGAMRTKGIAQWIKKISCSNYCLFIVYCKIVEIKQVRQR